MLIDLGYKLKRFILIYYYLNAFKACLELINMFLMHIKWLKMSFILLLWIFL